MFYLDRRALLKSTALTVIRSHTKIGITAVTPHLAPRREVKAIEKLTPVVIVSMEPSQPTLPFTELIRLPINEAYAAFATLSSENDVLNAMHAACKRGVMAAAIRNNLAAAQAALTDIANSVSRECYAHIDFEDLRTIIDCSRNFLVPNVVAGSGTAHGPSAGLDAFHTAIMNTESGQAKKIEHMASLLILVSTSQRFVQPSTQSAITNALRQKFGSTRPVELYGTCTDESLGDAVRVTVLAAF